MSGQLSTIKRVTVMVFQWAPCLTSYNSFHLKEWFPQKGMHNPYYCNFSISTMIKQTLAWRGLFFNLALFEVTLIKIYTFIVSEVNEDLDQFKLFWYYFGTFLLWEARTVKNQLCRFYDSLKSKRMVQTKLDTNITYS